MDVLCDAMEMLEKHALCDHCLGRQFAMLGHGMDNDERGEAIKLILTFRAHALALSRSKKGLKILGTLATHGFSLTAKDTLRNMGKKLPEEDQQTCFLCEDKFNVIDRLVGKALELLHNYEYGSFLVGIELPVSVAEREDEFKAEFEVKYGENLRNEFGRAIGKRIAEHNAKEVEFNRPEIVVLVNPYTEETRLQVNPLFIGGRYRKLVRGIPQSKWFCSSCRGGGCEKCNWTGKMYPESVQEIIGKPLLDATDGVEVTFHASGREDIDARMLGSGRPFVIEVSKPKRRLLDLAKLEEAVNAHGKGRVKVSNLKPASRDAVRRLKKGESTQKEYRLLMEFENRITDKGLRSLEQSLTNATVRQETPLRVLHRRANLTREKYIYEVNVKKLSHKKAEMRIRCQGGLYVKELVTGDEGRTVPSVSELLKNKAKPLKLDVLNVIMED
jgi:tRNA pseudouridine synthase 10